MHLSKAQITRLLILGLIVISGWTIWKRLDAIIDNYKSYYDTALGMKIIQDMWGQMKDDFDGRFNKEMDNFNREFDKRRDNFNREFDKNLDRFNQEFNKGLDRNNNEDNRGAENLYAEKEHKGLNDDERKEHGSNRIGEQEQEMERKWQEYSKKAPIKPHNKPVPMIADEWAKGYYSGFWNFLITSGLASVFAAAIVILSGGFLIRFVYRKLTDEKIENMLKKVGLG